MIRAWVPTLTGVNPGAGQVRAEYEFDGRVVHAELSIRLGAGCSVSFNPSFTLPVEARVPSASFRTYGAEGSVKMGTSIFPLFTVSDDVSPHAARPYLLDAASSGYRLISSTAPGVWGSGNELSVSFRYHPASPVMPVTFAAVGDSMTAWDSNQTAFDANGSWVRQVPTAGLAFAGGFARGSATTQYLLSIGGPVLADVAVILAGVNDIYFGIQPSLTLANIESLAAMVGTTRIVLCALAPYDANPAAAMSLSAAYQLLAISRGWGYVDPYATLRTIAGTWVAGASADGVHPSAASQQVAATAIRAHLLA